MKKIIKNSLNHTIKGLDMPQVEFSLQIPKNKEHGDLATNIAFLLAKQIGDTPLNIASKIKVELEKTDLFSEITIANPGFINMRINAEAIVDNLNFIISKKNSYGANKSGEGKKVLLEFVSANPTGPLHVGHIRGAVYGSALSKILNYYGFNVKNEYYVNDAGNQIKEFGISILNQMSNIKLKSKINSNEDSYKGSYISDLAHSIQNEIEYHEIDEDKIIDNVTKIGVQKMLGIIKNDLNDSVTL